MKLFNSSQNLSLVWNRLTKTTLGITILASIVIGNQAVANSATVTNSAAAENLSIIGIGDTNGFLSGGSFKGSISANVESEKDEEATLNKFRFFDPNGKLLFTLESLKKELGDEVFQQGKYVRCPGQILCWNFEFWLSSGREPNPTFLLEAEFEENGTKFSNGFVELKGNRVGIVSATLTSTSDTALAPVPEPLTILGSATALGFGALLKRESSKKKNKS